LASRPDIDDTAFYPKTATSLQIKSRAVSEDMEKDARLELRVINPEKLLLDKGVWQWLT